MCKIHDPANGQQKLATILKKNGAVAPVTRKDMVHCVNEVKSARKILTNLLDAFPRHELASITEDVTEITI